MPFVWQCSHPFMCDTFRFVQSVLAYEQTLQFPSVARASHRLLRAKSAFVVTLLSSVRTVLGFTLVWSVVHWSTLRLNRGVGLALVRLFVGVSTAPAATTVLGTASGALGAGATAFAAAATGSGAVASAGDALATVAFGPVSALFPVHLSSVLKLLYWTLLLNVSWQWARVVIDLFYTEVKSAKHHHFHRDIYLVPSCASVSLCLVLSSQPLAFDQYLLKGLVDVRNPYARVCVSLASLCPLNSVWLIGGGLVLRCVGSIWRFWICWMWPSSLCRADAMCSRTVTAPPPTSAQT